MPNYQYRVVPAPQKGLKAKGIKTPQDRFSNALEHLMNTMGAEGWEYQRAETLPSIERAGLTKTTTEWRNVLVFRKLRENDLSNFAPELLPAPAPLALNASQEVASETEEAPGEQAGDAGDLPVQHAGATHMLSDNGVEETSEVAGMTNSLERLAASRNLKETID